MSKFKIFSKSYNIYLYLIYYILIYILLCKLNLPTWPRASKFCLHTK